MAEFIRFATRAEGEEWLQSTEADWVPDGSHLGMEHDKGDYVVHGADDKPVAKPEAPKADAKPEILVVVPEAPRVAQAGDWTILLDALPEDEMRVVAQAIANA